ncbi:MAG TPA: TIM-barrel domain-containing protein [Puia sp.]|nr:TIM-barrel domain-containing protein [Puia sp.]
MIAFARPKPVVAALLCFILVLVTSHSLHAQTPVFKKEINGITIYPDTTLSGNARWVKLQVVTANIVRVVAGPSGTAPSDTSLIRVPVSLPAPKWVVEPGNGEVVLKTDSITATVSTTNGAVQFKDFNGNTLLTEKKDRQFRPAVFDGQPSFHIRQTFLTAPGEAIYGLGQHQDDILDYNHEQVEGFQNNTEVVIPFFVSDKHYGVLIDNCSLSRFGDLRDFMPLSRLKLFARDGAEGYLTETFRNGNNGGTGTPKILVSRAASSIAMDYLGDSKTFFPEGFKPSNGTVTWEGSVSSSFTGLHKFRFRYGGYLRVWIGEKELVDRWRQAWNPGSATVDVYFEKDRKQSIRIEWKPDGDESYISAKWLDPAPPGTENDFGFAAESGDQLDYYLVYGSTMDNLIGGYRLLTGKAGIVPKWAMGLWQSRERYKSEEELLGAFSEFRKRKIPIDNIVLDWSYWKLDAWGSQEFDPVAFPSPDSMIDQVHRQHGHFMISVWPKFYTGIPAYDRFNSKGWLYKRNVADDQHDWKGFVSTFYDAFNADARSGFWDLIHDKLYKKGVDAFWMDASEPDILSNVNPEKRKEEMTPTALGPAAGVLNAYPLENARGIYEGQRSADPNKRVFILTRSAFAGSQRYGAAVWSGDIGARWADMKTQITAGINFSLSGLPWWTMDIGGFAVEHRFEKPNDKDLEEWREQMTRWYQFGAFCPLFRVHGQYPYREIFHIAPEDHPAYQSMLYYDRLRYRLMPYLYTLAGMVWQRDYTLMRGLVMDFAKDPVASRTDDEYMFGPSLLINPVYTFGARNREVYLPAGSGWYDLYSGSYTEGGQKIIANAPYTRMPVYVKAGSILPLGPDLQYSDEKPADPVTLYVYTGGNAECTLYEDDGGSYGYEKGQYTNIPVSYEESTGMLTIGKRSGAFPGMLKERTFRIVIVSKSKPAGLDVPGEKMSTVRYSGSQKTIRLK